MDETIEKLAEAMDVTADNLWAVLVRQAPIEALSACFTLGIPVLAGLLVMRMDPVKMALLFEDEGDELDNATAFFVGARWGLAGLAAFVFLITAKGSIPTILSGIFNPEYLALREILDALGGS